MQYEIKIHSVPTRHLAIVRRRVAWSELGSRLIPLIDRVYAQVRASKVIPSGQNVVVYKDATEEGATIEAGVEVSGPLEGADDVVYSSTPSGKVASTLHIGPHSDLPGAHDAVIRWCEEHGHSRANMSWEVYGDWHDDPAQLQTEVFYLLDAE